MGRNLGPTAFVLSGGASLGAIQVGMLQALYERGIEPDFVVGASAGAGRSSR
jgi:NTE family protein